MYVPVTSCFTILDHESEHIALDWALTMGIIGKLEGVKWATVSSLYMNQHVEVCRYSYMYIYVYTYKYMYIPVQKHISISTSAYIGKYTCSYR
jgi:hypothetical protein